ncbi:hypothetical protein A7U60_g3693 [Sanghuangporus baumii]|uniref:Uncharacterized protein n=1 Tax=Sanghuangporus baumii TaxID=108892 RepID=A0A9Q5N6K7_SANBA|nr:hypothetical protein A7U60_g3693 [Sanghuangporus baumii]
MQETLDWSSEAAGNKREGGRSDVLKLAGVPAGLRRSTGTRYFELEFMRDEDVRLQVHSSLDRSSENRQEEPGRCSLEQSKQVNGKQEDGEDESKKELDHVKQLRSLLETDSDSGLTLHLATWKLRECIEILETDSDSGLTLHLATWKLRECIEILKKGPREAPGQLVARYIRWTQEGYDALARTISAFIQRQPHALRRIAEADTQPQEKLQMLLESHGLDWNAEERARTETHMACIEITEPGIPRGKRVRIARFATGWHATPQSIAKGLFEDWAHFPDIHSDESAFMPDVPESDGFQGFHVSRRHGKPTRSTTLLRDVMSPRMERPETSQGHGSILKFATLPAHVRVKYAAFRGSRVISETASNRAVP